MNKLVLGTVQMGMKYGINNTSGKISRAESFRILSRALEFGISTLDTAQVYGDAHNLIGDFHKSYIGSSFQIITKFPSEITSNLIEKKVREYIDTLSVDYIDTIMFHSFDSFVKNKDSIDSIIKLKNKGLIANFGVSVYTNSQIEYLLKEDLINVVQLPFNLLDNINLRGEVLEKLKKAGKSVHTRSVFLQGLFFKNEDNSNVILKKLKTEISLIHEIARYANCSITELALSYCLKQDNIDKVIIGIDSLDHLNFNIKASEFKISDSTLSEVNQIFITDRDILNPASWPM